MLKKYLSIFIILVFLLNNNLLSAQERQEVKPFPLTAIKLLDGPFKHATDLNIKSLLNYEPDRLLARFRIEAGLAPKAEPYKGWEAETLAGHSLGHHLSACAMMYQTTGDQRFLDRVNHIVNELAICQEANKNGYIGAMTNGKRIFETEVAKGNIRSQGFDLNGLWSPFYTHHKVLAGLLDAYELGNNKQALTVATRFADWVGMIVSGLTEAQVQDMLNCEFGGIQESLANLYSFTKNDKYLKLAQVFHHNNVINPLTEGKDILSGKHANTQIPKLIASAKIYELSGNDTQRKAADFFWNTVVHHHSYVTGGNGNHEYFGEPDHLNHRLSDETTETCNVYNMLKLSQHLFSWKPSAEVADFYERALFNHILATQHPENGRVIYNLSLEMGGTKAYQDPEDFTCCVGSGMETHSKYGGSIYYHNDAALYISQYIASQLDWKEQGITLTQHTRYPEEQGTIFHFNMKKSKTLALHIRYPAWAEKGIEIIVNGKKQIINNKPGSFITINRKWKNNDKVEVKFPFSLHLEAMPDNMDRIAVLYGPLVLAGDLGPVDDAKAKDIDYVPVFMSEERSPTAWLEPFTTEINTFMSKRVGNPRDVVFKPFYKIHDRRYSVYFDLFNEAKWKAQQAVYAAEQERKSKLETMTYDAFQPGEMQPERDHNFTGDKLNLTENFQHRKARGAERGGWLAFDMKVKKGAPMALVIEYWGGYTGSKTFDILVNDVKIATENISGKKDGSFLDVQYDIPNELTVNSDKITIKFAPHEGHRAGPFFFARTITTK